MERDKVKVVKAEGRFELYINGTRINFVKDILVDELDIYSDVTIKLACVDLEVINEHNKKEKQGCTMEINSKVLEVELNEYIKNNLVNKVGD